jgi:hypothetical protein
VKALVLNALGRGFDFEDVDIAAPIGGEVRAAWPLRSKPAASRSMECLTISRRRSADSSTQVSGREFGTYGIEAFLEPRAIPE